MDGDPSRRIGDARRSMWVMSAARHSNEDKLRAAVGFTDLRTKDVILANWREPQAIAPLKLALCLPQRRQQLFQMTADDSFRNGKPQNPFVGNRRCGRG